MLAEWCKRLRVSVWHAHDYKTDILGTLLRRRHPMKLVTTMHGFTAASYYPTNARAFRERGNPRVSFPAEVHLSFNPEQNSMAMLVDRMLSTDPSDAGTPITTHTLAFGGITNNVSQTGTLPSVAIDQHTFGANEPALNEAWTGQPDFKISARVGNGAEDVGVDNPAHGFKGSVGTVQAFRNDGGFFPNNTKTLLEFMTWGYWTGEFSHTEQSTDHRRDHFNINPWVAGSPVDLSVLPSNGIASYDGFAVAHLVHNGEVVMDGARFTGTANFGDRVMSTTFTNLFEQDVSINGMTILPNGTEYSGSAQANLLGVNRQVEVSGMFFQAQNGGALDTAAATGGTIQITEVIGGNAATVGSGVFAGDRVAQGSLD